MGNAGVIASTVMGSGGEKSAVRPKNLQEPDKPFGSPRHLPISYTLPLRGSWDLVTGVINKVTILIITYNPN